MLTRLSIAVRVVTPCLLAAGLVVAQPFIPPTDYTGFEVVTVACSDHPCYVNQGTIDKMENSINPTYLYFPPLTNASLDPIAYVIDNPVVVNRTTPLYVHGGDARLTRLAPKNPALPLFIVEDVPRINFSNLILMGGQSEQSGPIVSNQVLLDFPDCRSNCVSALEFEIQEAGIEAGQISIRREGSYRTQATDLQASQLVPASIVIDHPSAAVTVVGGNSSSLGPNTAPYEFCLNDNMPSTDYCESYHIWQKRGRLQVYGLGTQASPGRADFRIETRSGMGPHIIANVRSEGRHCVPPSWYPWNSSMGEPEFGVVYVPPTPEAVDVLLSNNVASLISLCNGESDDLAIRGRGHFVDYNGAGKIWLVANNSDRSVGRIAKGNAKQGSEVVALGNQYLGNTQRVCVFSGNTCVDNSDCAGPGLDACGVRPLDAFPITQAQVTSAGNIWRCGRFREWSVANQLPCPDCVLCDDPEIYASEFVNPGEAGNSTSISESSPPMPELEIPQPLGRPVVTKALGQMAKVTECRVGAPACQGLYPIGCQATNGTYDDRCSIQATLNRGIKEQLPVFIPAGDYVVNKPLFFAHGDQDAELVTGVMLPAGRLPAGWIAGGGDGVTVRAQRSCVQSGAACVTNQDCAGGTDVCQEYSAFATEGMAFGLIQGISFGSRNCESTAGVCDDDSDCPSGVCSGPVGTQTCSNNGAVCTEHEQCEDSCSVGNATTMSLENDDGFGYAQKQVTMHDVHFEGGRHGLGIGMHSEIQCDTNMVVDGSFSHAQYGLAIGGQNALNNIAYNASFIGNDVAMGHDPDPAFQNGGSWYIYHATITDTQVKDIEWQPSGASFLLHDVTSSSQQVLFEADGSAALFPPMFEQCTLTPPGNGAVIIWRHAMGPTLAYTDITQGQVLLQDWDCEPGCAGVRYAQKLYGDIPDWGIPGGVPADSALIDLD